MTSITDEFSRACFRNEDAVEDIVADNVRKFLTTLLPGDVEVITKHDGTGRFDIHVKGKYYPIPCDGCQWYHEWFDVCCNGDSEWRGDVSERCELYVAGAPLHGSGGVTQMEKVEVKMYAVAISTKECYKAMRKKQKRMELLTSGYAAPNGVYQSNDWQFMLYIGPNRAKEAYKILRTEFKTAKLVANPAYVDATYLTANK